MIDFARHLIGERERNNAVCIDIEIDGDLFKAVVSFPEALPELVPLPPAGQA